MKKHLCSFAFIAINLVILAGCSNYGNTTSSAKTENTLIGTNSSRSDDTTETKTASSQSVDTADWKPTPYETVNNFDGVTMTVKKGTASPTGLTVAFENNSNSQCIYGQYFLLEKKINGRWYQVPVAIDGSYGFNDIGYTLASGDDGEWAVDWDWLYGSLDAGEYRIVKDIADFRGPGDYDTYYLAAEFTIY